MYLVSNHQKNGKIISYLATHRNKGEEANYIRYDFLEAAIFHFFPLLDWSDIAAQKEPKEVGEWEEKLESVVEDIFKVKRLIKRDEEDLDNPDLKDSPAAKKSLDKNNLRLPPLEAEQDLIVAKIASLKQGARVFENVEEFKELIKKSTIDLTKGLPISPDVMKARQDLKTEIHRKISMCTFNFFKTQEGPAAEIKITFANGVTFLMTLFCESLRGFFHESDERTHNFDFDPDGSKARGRRCFTLKFKEGWTLDQIAAELHLNRITVHKTLRGKIRPYLYSEWFGHWPDGKISDHYLSDEERQEILKYHEQGLSFLEIACKTGRNRRTVSNIIMAAGVPHFNRRNGAHPCRPEAEEKKTILFNPFMVKAVPINGKNGH